MPTDTVSTVRQEAVVVPFVGAEGALQDPMPAATRAASGRYRILRQRSAGADGTAFDAADERTGQLVDLRRVAPAFANEERRAQVTSRLRLLGSFRHPAPLSILELALDDEPPTVVLEARPSETLADWNETHPASDVQARLEVAHRLCESLVAAHRMGITHGHLHGRTIFIDMRIVRLDFSGLETCGQVPTACEKFDGRSGDVLALAQILSELLGSEEVSQAISHRQGAALSQLLRQAAAPEAEQRPLVQDLARFVGELRGAAAECQPRSSASPDDETGEVAVDAFEQDDSTAETVPQFAAAPKPCRVPSAGEQLGRYQIVEKLGEGGMGAVFKATDLSDGRLVAIKTLNASAALRANALRRFQKESRMLAAVNNPFVTNLIEVNEDAGLHYMVVEFVDGVDLKKVLSRLAPLPEPQALAIAADVARALVDAHERGIVHRDIKPENVLLAGTVLPDEIEGQLSEPLQVKLSDFGIARYIDQSESLAVTQAGAILGTPRYMSPEQCKSQADVVPQSDVYSLGITLYEMLAGVPPFSSTDAMKLAAMHCFEAPPAIEKHNDRVSAAAVAIVKKALAKRPEDRYADAAHMLRELDRLLRGEPADISVHPLLPEHDPRRLFRAEFTWDLHSAPGDLWPYVSNTERLNRAIGLPAVEYRTENDPALGVRKFGSFRLAGVPISWEEHPFEWIEGRRMGILREFDRGPFKWFMSVVALEPLADGATRLRHQVRIAPRNTLGRVLAKVEAGIKGRRSLDRVYRRIDRTLQQRDGRPNLLDPFEPPEKLTAARRQRLEDRLERLVERGVSPELASKLGEFIASAPAQEVAKIAPLALADRVRCEQDEVLEACLLAAKEGLLTLQWDILCPTCRVSADTRATLRELQAHTFCEACNVDFESNLANSIELVFRAHADLRSTQVGKYCIGGPEHSPHVVAQVRIAPQERMELELALPSGEYLLRGPQLPSAVTLRVQPNGAPSHSEVALNRTTDSRFVPVLRAGQQLLRVTNGHDTLQLVRIERTISRQEVVTAAQAASLPTFRTLFPGEILGSGRLVTAEQVTLLVTRIENTDWLYESHTDGDAYGVLQQHFELLEREICRKRGGVVKVLGDGVMAVFHEVSDAVAAAFALQSVLAASEVLRQLQLGVAVHRGATIVTTMNDRLDYFGATARIATALPAHTRGSVVLTEAVFSDPAVAAVLHDRQSTTDPATIDLPGRPNLLVQSFRFDRPPESQ